MPTLSTVPDHSFLGAYKTNGAFTDCYAVTVPGVICLAELVEAFYTTRLFKLERWLIAKVLGQASSDLQIRRFARGETDTFSAWHLERRSMTEILVCAGRTRSWLSVVTTSAAPPSTTLYFGSAVVSVHSGGKFGLVFHALGGFHRLYSKLLLSAASRRVVKGATRRF